MADGFTLEIDEDLAWSIERRASEAGMSREEYARKILAQEAFGFDEAELEQPGIPWDGVKAWIESWGTPNELPKPG